MNHTTITATHRCPRRNEHHTTPADTWQDHASIAGGIEPCCTWCGSLRPEEFLKKVRDGWIVVPTDKSHKAYLDKPYNPTELAHIKTRNPGWHIIQAEQLGQGHTPEEAAAAADAWWNEHEAPGISGHTVAKLYFAHLDRPQQAEFIELHRTGAMRMAWPGRFYATPNFTTRTELGRQTDSHRVYEAAGDD